MKYRVIVLDNEVGEVVMNQDWENISFQIESGIKFNTASDEKSGSIDSNGQSIMDFRAWTGCPTYETFQTDAKPCPLMDKGEDNVAG